MSKYKRNSQGTIPCGEPKLKDLKADLAELDMAIGDFTELEQSGHLGYGENTTMIYGQMFLRRRSLVAQIADRKKSKKDK